MLENPIYQYKRLTSSNNVKGTSGYTANGVLGGFIAASASAGTIAIYDGIDNTGTLILNTMSLTPGTSVPLPVAFNVGLYAVIGGTADVTVWYN